MFFFSRELFPTSEEEQLTSENCFIEDVNNDTVKEENVIIPSSTTSVDDTQTPIEPDPVETKTTSSSPVDVKTNEMTTDNVNDQIPSPLSSPIKIEQTVDNEPSTTENVTTNENPSEFFYDFQAEHFHAEQVRKIFRCLNS